MSDSPAVRSPRSRSLPTLLRRLTLFAIIAAAQFGLFEAGMRLWGASEAEPGFQRLFTGDPVIGYRLAPGASTHFTTAEFETEIAISRQGVRDDREYGARAPNEHRIAVLGDSIVLSVQVDLEQTFCRQLEARLNARGGPATYRVINAGVQGYGPVEDVLFYERVVRPLRPATVLLVLYVGNDAEEALRSANRLLPGGGPAVASASTNLSTRLRRVVRHSMVLQTVGLRVRSVTDRFTHFAPPEPPLQSYAANPVPRIRMGLDATRRAVERLAADVSQDDGRLAIVYMPARFQLDDGDYGRLRRIVEDAGGELVRDAATSRLEATLAGIDVPKLDLLPAMRATRPGPDLYFQQTAHLTPFGHRVVAAAIADNIDRLAGEAGPAVAGGASDPTSTR
jgi:lysophospholipase L1-like esterase